MCWFLKWIYALQLTIRQWILSVVFPYFSKYVLNRRIHPAKQELFKSLQNESKLRILEIGIGGGFNLDYFPAGAELVAVEPNPHWTLPADQLKKFSRVDHILGVAEDMHRVPDGSIDAVVSTYCLCYVNSVEKSIQEISRVLKDGGKFYWFDHVTFDKKQNPLLRWCQNFVQPISTYIMCGCVFKRPTHQVIRRLESHTGLVIDWFRYRQDLISGLHLAWLWPVMPHDYGVAVKQSRKSRS